MPIRERWNEIKATIPARTTAGSFLYFLMTWPVAILGANEPTRTFYSYYKAATQQQELDTLVELGQYTAFWAALSHVGGAAAFIVGFALGPRVVDKVRVPAVRLGNFVGDKLRDTPVGRAAETVNRTVLQPVERVRHRITDSVGGLFHDRRF